MMAFIIFNLKKFISLNQKPYFLNYSMVVLSHFKIKYFFKKKKINELLNICSADRNRINPVQNFV